MSAAVKELSGWQYVNGRRVAVRRTDQGFIVSHAATRQQIVRGMVELLQPVVPAPRFSPSVEGYTRLVKLPMFENAIVGGGPNRET